MVWESIFDLIEQDKRKFGKIGSVIDMANVCKLTAIYMRAYCFKIESTAPASKDQQTEKFIKEIELMINKDKDVKTSGD